jgi:hypothetical protein
MPETPSLEKEDREMLSQEKFVRKEKKNNTLV